MAESNTLDEIASRSLLVAYGIPVPPGRTVPVPADAPDIASDMGYPVVLKAVGSRLTHKTERGLVRVGLETPQAVARAAAEVWAAAGSDAERLLVQAHVAGQREFVAGAFRDPTFGPVVMFGLGGTAAEALGQVTFGLAPLSRSDAERMLEVSAARTLLGPFRGEAAADRRALVDVLTGLGRLMAERPDVAEVDVNPIKITPHGTAMAVDALVVLETSPATETVRPPVAPRALAKLFHPNSVAFVGASGTFGKWGHMLPVNLIGGGFEGAVYLVNPRGGHLFGHDVLASVQDLPEGVDLAVVTIPATGVLPLLQQLAARGVGHVLLITSGFGETGPEGRVLEAELVTEAHRLGLVILGPNTMGIANPHHHLYLTGAPARPAPGGTALLSQSGNMGVQLLAFAEAQGLGIRAFGGTGNEAMVAIEDGVDAFEVDDKTRTVLLYVESVKNGRRFYEGARRVSRVKPVIVLKGGRTDEGSRAAASHTGALASDFAVFQAACRQAGVVLVDQPGQMLDFAAAFSSLPLPRGRRVAVMTLGGGWGVVAADLCVEHGLRIPPLSSEITTELDALLPPYWSRANPVDLVGENDPTLPARALEMLARWDGCDAVINLGILGRKRFLGRLCEAADTVEGGACGVDPSILIDRLARVEQGFIDLAADLMEKYRKPILGVSLLPDERGRTVFDAGDRSYKGLFFPSPERAVASLAAMVDYRGFLDRETA